MALLHLDRLPRGVTRGTIVRLLVQVGGIDKRKIGAIDVRGRRAVVEMPAQLAPELVKALDGAMLDHHHIRAYVAAEGRPQGDDHFSQLLTLMEKESRAQASQIVQAMKRLSPEQAEQQGHSLVGLTVRDAHPGLGGRLLLTLGKGDPSLGLPWTRLGVGAPVLLTAASHPDSWRGVISEFTRRSVQLALSSFEPARLDQAIFRVDLSFDETARLRQQAALNRASSASGDRLAELREVLLANQEPRFDDRAPPISRFDHSLNDSQWRAVEKAMAAEDVAIIHGPPGTGKTTTVIEVIRQAIARGDKVLACAPSNIAVDNLLERLLSFGQRAVRLGHPARVLPQLRAATLDLIVADHPDTRIARKLVQDAHQLFDKAAKRTRAKPAPGARGQMRRNAAQMLEDARRIEAQVVQHVLDTADALCVTNTGLDSEIVGQRFFDWAIIDEACQSTEPPCWIPLLRCQRLVLAGDHCQLPPTVVSAEAQREGFGVSLQERLVDQIGPHISQLLEVQYRMNESIMRFSSDEFYGGRLRAAPSVREHLLADLDGVQEDSSVATPLEFIDTAGAGYDEEKEPGGESRRNPQEAELAARQVERLLELGLPPGDIALISPYAAQVRMLRERLKMDDLEIDSVDGFQGREKEAVVISLVRSNSAGQIGFLGDTRRMNVALTRARRKLIVIGDSATIGGHPFYGRLLEYFERQGAYRTVWEFLE